MFESYEEYESFIHGRVGQLRTLTGDSAREMSLSIGQGPAYINNIENGNSLPSLKGLFYICEHFKISPSDFFDDGTKSPQKLQNLMDVCKDLDDKTLDHLFNFIKSSKK